MHFLPLNQLCVIRTVTPLILKGQSQAGIMILNVKHMWLPNKVHSRLRHRPEDKEKEICFWKNKSTIHDYYFFCSWPAFRNFVFPYIFIFSTKTSSASQTMFKFNQTFSNVWFQSKTFIWIFNMYKGRRICLNGTKSSCTLGMYNLKNHTLTSLFIQTKFFVYTKWVNI